MLVHKVQSQPVDLPGRFHLHHLCLARQDLDVRRQPGAAGSRNDRIVTAPESTSASTCHRYAGQKPNVKRQLLPWRLFEKAS